MATTTSEIADGIHRISTWTPAVAPEGFTFNQVLVVADEPLLFHTGPRSTFPDVAEAVERIVPLERLRWISFGHVEADECGAVNLLLAAAPHAQVAFNPLGVDVTLADLCDRQPVVVPDGEALDLGGRRLRFLQTPHVPHGWEAQVLHEEVTGTLLCGDLLSTTGDGPAVTGEDLVERALALDAGFGVSALGPRTGEVLRGLAALAPTTLATMHGSSFAGDGGRALLDLAGAYEGLAAPA